MIADESLERVLPRPTVALVGDLIRAVLWLGVALGWIAIVMIYARLGRLIFEGGANDFTIFYYTAVMVSEGRPMYGDLPAEYGLAWNASHLGNLNPPHFQLLFLPMVPLGYRGAVVAWGVLNALLVAASLWIAARELGIRWTAKRALVAGLAIFGSAPWISVAATGEMSLLLLLPFTLAWAAWRNGRWAAVGGWLGVCAGIKLFLLLFFVWLAAHRRWPALAAAAAAGAGLVICGGLVFGFDTYGQWYGSLERVGWWWLPMNVSLRGLVARLFNPGPAFAPLYHAPAVAFSLWVVLAGVVGAVSGWRLRPGGPLTGDPDRTMIALLLLALLLSPLGWVYYLPLATAPVIAWVLSRRFERGPAAIALAVLAAVTLYLPLEATEAAQPSPVATFFLASAYSWGALALWSLTIAREAPDR